MEWFEQEINLHITGIAKPNETDYKMPRTTGINGHCKLAVEDSGKRSKHKKPKEL
jgi:hypothetical protein